MATIEEVRGKFKNRFDQFKVKTPLRVAYLGDGRGGATSNMVPPGEPDKFWARESIDGDKPFKILNRNPNFTPQFNLPVLLGYPEDDPEQEQVMGIHRALVQFSIGNAGSAIGGVAPHHVKHEWGGGDEVFVDPRMFKPGLIKPTAPTSMKVKILSFQHYYNYWRRYDGGISPDLAQYKPSADYRYVLLTLDPDTNQLCVRPGNVFTPDLSIDSIISNQATNTFRHIPVPPGNEIPLGVILLEPSTTKLDWNINGINNILPMRILLSSPMKEVNERILLLESATGISSLPSTGAANSVQTDLLPGRIDGNITRLVLNRSSSSATLPALFVGELAFVNNSPSAIWVGTASGNHAFNVSGGGGATTLGDLTDVNISVINNQNLLKYDAATSSWIGASALSIGGNSSGIYFDVSGLIGITAPLRLDNDTGAPLLQANTNISISSVPDGNYIQFTTPEGEVMRIGGANGEDNVIEINADGVTPTKFIGYTSDPARAFEFDADSGFRFETANSVSALDIQYFNKKIVFNNDTGASPLLMLDTADNKVVFGRSGSYVSDASFEIHSPSNIRVNYIGHVNHYSPTLNRATIYSYFFKDPSGNVTERFSHAYATVAASYGSYGFSGTSAGIMRSSLFVIDTSVGEVSVNDLGSVLDFRTEGSTSSYSNLFKTDAKLNAVQIGTSVAGQMADFRSHLIEFNKNQNDIDVKFHGTSQNALVIDANNNRVGIGTDTPLGSLHIVGETLIESATQNYKIRGRSDRIAIVGQSAGQNAGLEFFPFDGDGTDNVALTMFGVGTPDNITNRERLFFNYSPGNAWQISSDAAGTGTLRPIRIGMATTASQLVLGISGGVILGNPTGGDKGIGTLNATAVYDDNVLLTCYPIEYARTGSINLVEMDRKYGRGDRHKRAHDFSKKARDLVDVREYSKKWKSDGHLPLLPSRQEWETRQQIPVGEMTQSLAETVELQAIHIDNLQQQIDELKSMIKGLNNE